MADIVKRLRMEAAQCDLSPCDCQCPNLIEAADEIERLRAERRELLHRANLLADAIRAYLDSDHDTTSKAFTALSRWDHRPGNCNCCADLHAEARRG